jgi:hypothetical protein
MVATGSPAPTGYDFVGTFNLVAPPAHGGPLTVDVYRKR